MTDQSEPKPFKKIIKIGNRTYEQVWRPPVGEPHYEDEETTPKKWAKWQMPDGIALEILQGVGRERFADKREKRDIETIIANSLPLAKGDSDFPEEWIRDRIKVAQKLRSEGKLIGLTTLVKMIKNTEKKHEFVVRWSRANGKVGSDDYSGY